MANLKVFKGFKQVTEEQFKTITAEEKLGYLWLVRSNIVGDSYEGDIYFGTRHYGHQGAEVTELETNIKTILKDAGILTDNSETININTLIEKSKLTSGIAIDVSTENKINVKVASETNNAINNVDTKKNFAHVNTQNEIEVKGVDIDSSVIAKDITIEGGEWAEAVKKVYSDGKLPAGTTLQSFFESMLCVEKWGTPTEPQYKFTASVAAPIITITPNKDKVPVGTKLQFKAVHGNLKSVANTATVSNLTYGYSIDGITKTSSNTSYSANITEPTITGNYKLDCKTNAKLQSVNDTIDGSTGSEKEYYVLKGTGIYTANETGQTVTKGNLTDAEIYNVSNLGNVRNTDKKSITNTAFQADGNSSITPTSNATKSVTGYYPVYYGTLSNVNMTQDEITESLIKQFGDNNDTMTNKCSMPAGTGSYICAIPNGNANYSKSKLLLKDSKDMSFGASNNFTLDIKMLNDVETVTYKVFFITNAGTTTSASNWNISFE